MNIIIGEDNEILVNSFPHMGLYGQSNPKKEGVIEYLKHMKHILQKTFEGSREPCSRMLTI